MLAGYSSLSRASFWRRAGLPQLRAIRSSTATALVALSFLLADRNSPSAQAATATYTFLGEGSGGTTVNAGEFVPWNLGALPLNSILRQVDIVLRLEVNTGGSWISDLNFMAGGNPLIGADSGAPLGLNGGDIEDTGVTVTVAKVDTDWNSTAFGDIDLHTVPLGFKNFYATAAWSGTFTITYDEPGAFVGLTWKGADSTVPMEWSTNASVTGNWNDGANNVAYANGQNVVFDDSVGAGARTVDLSVADVTPQSVAFNNTGANTYTLTGTKAITGTTTLVKQGSGVLIINNANSYSGKTSIFAGTLRVGNVNALPHGSGKSTVILNGTLDLNGFSPTLNGLSGTGTVTNSVVGNATLSVGDANTTSSFAGVIADGAGTLGLTKIGTGKLTITGLNDNTYSGGTIINDGTLYLYDKQSFNPLGTGPVTLNGGSLWLDRATITSNVTVNGGSLILDNGFGSAITGNITNNVPLNITAFYVSHPLSGVISGSGGITLSSSFGGGVQLSGMNTYSGATLVSSGILSLGNALAIQNSPLDTLNSIMGNATNGLRTTVTTLTMGGLTGNKNLFDVFDTAADGGPGGTTAQGGYSGLTALTLNPGTGASYSYSGVIADGFAPMTLTKTGAGTQTLTGANTYTGKTVVQNGTVSFSVGNASATADQQLGKNAALDLGAAASSGTLLYTGAAGTLAKAINVLGNGTDTIQKNGAGALTLSGGITGLDKALTIGGTGDTTITSAVNLGATSGALTKSGAGLLNIDAGFAQTYKTLTTTAGAGTTNVNSALTATGGTNVVANGNLKFGSVSQTLSSLTIGAGATVTFTSGVASGSFSGGGGKASSLSGSAVVPEPGTIGLLLAGSLGLIARRRHHA